jgi:hypothetical protein
MIELLRQQKFVESKVLEVAGPQVHEGIITS